MMRASTIYAAAAALALAAGTATAQPEMVSIEPGSFEMGSPIGEEGRNYDENQHRVTVEKPFLLARHEVTVAEFRRFAEATQYRTDTERNVVSSGCYSLADGSWRWRAGVRWRAPGFKQDGRHPVVCVSYTDATVYIDWLNETTGAGDSGRPYRLPTEAEWEYAARAGTKEARFWGDRANDACSYANVADRSAKQMFSDSIVHECTDGFVYTAPVTEKRSNPWGLQHVLGNVWEWTCSAYVPSYEGSEMKCADDPTARRVVRGGSWDNFPRRVRSANRFGATVGHRNIYLGFRLARDL